MPIDFAVILGLVQALTEFLPVSSSGHLVLIQQALGAQFGVTHVPLVFDVLVHVATLLVVCFFLRKDLLLILRNIFSFSATGTEVRRLALLLIVATIPAVLVVLLAKDEIESGFQSLHIVAIGFLVTTFLLEFGHRRQTRTLAAVPSASEAREAVLGWALPSIRQAAFMGLLQALAIVPGISRSGSTIAAGLIGGLPADRAVRFSLFMLLPAVGGAAVLEAKSLFHLASVDLPAYAAGFGVTVFAGWFGLIWLVRFARAAKLRWFAAYTLLLSLVIQIFLLP